MSDLEQDLDRLVDDNPRDGVFRVHARAFTDPRVFELEKQRVFARSWIYAAHESELKGPNSFIARKIGGRELIIAQDPSGTVRAFINACRHRGALVCREPAGCAKTFVCPYHGWSFDTRGRLVGLPGDDAYDGSAFDRKENSLLEVRLEQYRGFYFVNQRRDAEPLVDFLSGAKEFVDLVADQSPEGMEVIGGSHRYAIRANWKLVAENGIDAYHFRMLHRRYLNFVREKGGEPMGGQIQPVGRSLGNGHGGNEHETLASLGRMAGRWGPLIPEALKPAIDESRARLERAFGAERAFRITQANRNLRLFPNVYILDTNNTTIRTFFPTSVDYVEVTEWALAPKGESQELRHERLRTHSGLPGPASFVSPDDVETLESCQRGLTHEEMEWLDCSRGMKRKTHPLPTDELQHRGFFRYWHELVTRSRVRHLEAV